MRKIRSTISKFRAKFVRKRKATFLSVPVLLIMVMIGSACSSHHYFSINAEEITNPEIIYSDSTHVTNPF